MGVRRPESHGMIITVRMLCGSTWRMRYDQYLKTGVWRSFRAGWIDRHGDRCARCRRKGENLHHRTYDRVGHEHDDDVVLLCRQCHETFHGRHGMDVGRTDQFCSERVRFGHRIHGWRDELEDWGERAVRRVGRDLVWSYGRWCLRDAGDPDVPPASMKLMACAGGSRVVRS